MKRAAATLAERVHDAIPLSHIAYRSLLALLEIRPSWDIPTAAVTVGHSSRLLINPAFVAAHCRTREHLAMLVLHELYHVLLGHTRIFAELPSNSGVVLDAVINATLCREFPEIAYTSFFSRYYRHDRFPESLLRPPPAWRTPREFWPMTGPAGTVHRVMYGPGLAAYTYEELARTLRSAIQRARSSRELPAGSPEPGMPSRRPASRCTQPVPRASQGPLLLGGFPHPVDRDLVNDRPPEDAPLLRRAARIAPRWLLRHVSTRYGPGSRAEEAPVDPQAVRRQVRAVLRRALLAAAHDLLRNGASARTKAQLPEVLPYRTGRDRRGDTLAQLGVQPLLFGARMTSIGVQRKDRVHLYLDVSGSVRHVLPHLYGLLLAFGGSVHDAVHLFSTDVFDVRVENLKQGACLTTHGTSICCVTEHMIRNRIERAVIVTDGHVGAVPPEHAKRIRQVRLSVVLLDGGNRQFVADLPKATVFKLPRQL